MEGPYLGYGLMRMPVKGNNLDEMACEALIDEYMKGNFCYFDTHPNYLHGQSHNIIKRYIVEKYERNRYLIADKMPYYVNCPKDYEKIFDHSLFECGLDYFDYYLLHALTKKIYELHEHLGGIEFLKQKKAEGKVRYIGFSYHGDAKLLDEILRHHPEMDFVQLQINYLDWENNAIQSKLCYEIARKYDKKICVMEPIKGGLLANPVKYADRIYVEAELARLSIQFVAQLPGIHVILSGMKELKEIKANRESVSTRLEESLDIYDSLRMSYKSSLIPCTACHYCEQECLKKIPIPDILAALNGVDENREKNRSYLYWNKNVYDGVIEGKGKAADCIKCGKCEVRCPQKIEIRKYLKKAASFWDEQKCKNEKRVLWKDFVNTIAKGKELVLFGAGNCFNKNIAEILKYKQVKYVVDNNNELWGKEVFRGIYCISPNEIIIKENLYVLIMIEDRSMAKKIIEQLANMGVTDCDHIGNWMCQ